MTNASTRRGVEVQNRKSGTKLSLRQNPGMGLMFDWKLQY